jgi:hypothetical protein
MLRIAASRCADHHKMVDWCTWRGSPRRAYIAAHTMAEEGGHRGKVAALVRRFVAVSQKRLGGPPADVPRFRVLQRFGTEHCREVG